MRENETNRLDRATEGILAERRLTLARPWDARPCWEATLSDLALDLFLAGYQRSDTSQEMTSQNDRSYDEQLAAHRFYDLKHNRPTHAAILSVGLAPLSFVPGAYVQYVRYAGLSQADEVLRKCHFSGDLLSLLRSLGQLGEDLAEASPSQGEGLFERKVYAYPPRALNELFVNAVIHRNYDGADTPVLIDHYEDRIEIFSPGGLSGDLTPEQFPHGVSYRNPHLAEAARTLGFANRYGRGIAVAQAELTKNDSPPARFDLEMNHFLVTVQRQTGR